MVCVLTTVRNPIVLSDGHLTDTFIHTTKQMVLIQIYGDAPSSHVTELASVYSQTDISFDE